MKYENNPDLGYIADHLGRESWPMSPIKGVFWSPLESQI